MTGRGARGGAGLGFVVAVLGLLCMAPTPGDIGGCGDAPTEIPSSRYVAARKRLECDRCGSCGIVNARCERACNPKVASDVALPVTCRPLVHDVDVCLRALITASCSTFAAAVDDDAPISPSECLFCREGEVADADVSQAFADAGADAR